MVTHPTSSSSVAAAAASSDNVVAVTAPRQLPLPLSERVVTTPESSAPEVLFHESHPSEAGKFPGPDAVPVALEIPTASIRQELAAGGFDAEGGINPPPNTAMWLDDTTYDNVAPGQLGTSVIAGHVSYDGVPDVFTDLEMVQEGDEVHLDFSDGTSLELVVVSAEVALKSDLQTDARLWQAQQSERRVVIATCSDELGYRPDGHREANFVVIAVPAD